MINFDNITKKNIKELNLNWSQICDHQYNLLVSEGSASEKVHYLI